MTQPTQIGNFVVSHRHSEIHLQHYIDNQLLPPGVPVSKI